VSRELGSADATGVKAPASDPKPLSLLYAVIGVAAVAATAAASVTRGIVRAAGPLGRAVLHPPVLSERLHPGRAVDALADRGREAMASTGGDLERMIAVIVPAVVREVLDQLDLNALIRDRVDLDGLVATVDIAEMIERVDIDAVVRQVDVEGIVNRMDLDLIAKRIDIDAIADRIDLDRIVARIDIDAVVAGVDLNVVVDRLNVVGLAEEVINDIDLPEIIRDSTGSMASQVVRDARIQSFYADETVSRLVDRLLRRRRKRSTEPPRPLQAETDSVPDDESQP
jgi:hypothetical protein